MEAAFAAFSAEPGLRGCRVVAVSGEDLRVRDVAPAAGEGWVELRSDAGVLSVTGEVSTVGHRRLVGLVAWWIPGCVDVANMVEVVGPPTLEEQALAEDVRWLLDRDLAIDTRAISVRARGRVVRLDGEVPSHGDAIAAERAAWCVFGVDGVENRLQVRPSARRARR